MSQFLRENKMVLRRDKPSEKLAFERVRRAAAQYGVSLRKIAGTIGHMIDTFDVMNDPVALANMSMALFQYAKTLHPWAQAEAKRVMQEVGRRDTKAWEAYSRQMGLAIREELATTATGSVLRAAMLRQVNLITSLPIDAAQRVHDLVQANLAESKRAPEIAKMIMASSDVTKVRATLIARTEIARAASELTEARSVAVGSTHYIWRGVRDRRERDSHDAMEGRICEWANPPEVEPGKFYHAGRIYNCRCWPEPIVQKD
jgi:SPP1 gp7 family putative phage head morphogenesis protein